MVMKIDDVLAQVLALPAADRAKIVARIQTSLAEHDGNVAVVSSPGGTDPKPARLLDLAGTGRGLWGDDSTEYLQQLRDEWP